MSFAPSNATEVRRYGIIGGQHDVVLRLVKKLGKAEFVSPRRGFVLPASNPGRRSQARFALGYHLSGLQP